MESIHRGKLGSKAVSYESRWRIRELGNISRNGKSFEGRNLFEKSQWNQKFLNDLNAYCHSNFWCQFFFFFFFKEILLFSKDALHWSKATAKHLQCYKRSLFQINAVLLNFLIHQKNPDKNVSRFPQKY